MASALIVGLHRLVEAILPSVQIPHLDEDVGVVLPVLEHLSIGGQGLLVAALGSVNGPQALVRLKHVRIYLRRTLVGGDGLRALRHRLQGPAQVVVCAGEVGAQLQGPPEGLLRLLELALHRLDEAELVVHGGVVRVQLEAACIRLRGRFQILYGLVEISQGKVKLGLVRIQLNRSPQNGVGLRKAPLPRVDQTQLVVRPGEPRVLADSAVKGHGGQGGAPLRGILEPLLVVLLGFVAGPLLVAQQSDRGDHGDGDCGLEDPYRQP